jgi:hypothetical protein
MNLHCFASPLLPIKSPVRPPQSYGGFGATYLCLTLSCVGCPAHTLVWSRSKMRMVPLVASALQGNASRSEAILSKRLPLLAHTCSSRINLTDVRRQPSCPGTSHRARGAGHMFFAIFWAAYMPIGVILICIVGKWLMQSLRWRFAQRFSSRAAPAPGRATRRRASRDHCANRTGIGDHMIAPERTSQVCASIANSGIICGLPAAESLQGGTGWGNS